MHAAAWRAGRVLVRPARAVAERNKRRARVVGVGVGDVDVIDAHQHPDVEQAVVTQTGRGAAGKVVVH